ncbi:MAG: hypothetical protein EPN35_04250 [Rhodanobacter sp.]|nr:MAG: hypothetical protein EPN35_04250 [Rhodanobacter sp.]
MRTQVRSEVRSQVRCPALMAPAPGRRHRGPVGGTDADAAGRRLLETYAALAARGEHLLQGLLAGKPPRQWQHYPENDAIDRVSGYQWFYHSHSPEDRPGATEHGHFHLFARRPLWARRLRSGAEKAFAALTGDPQASVTTRHLLGIGMSAKGVPTSLFTVNSWVTGDLMLSAASTERLLARMHLDTSHASIDAVLESVVALCASEIHEVMAARDATLSSRPAHGVLADQNLELLSEMTIVL